MKVDQAAIDNARLQLTYCRITAPVGGRLGLRQVDLGNIVHAGDANGLVVITQLQPITVIFTHPGGQPAAGDEEAAAPARSCRSSAYDRAGKTQLASGTLLTVDNQIDPTTGTVQAEGAVRQRRPSLCSRTSSSTCACWSTRKRDATVVPAAAVQRGTPGTFVYVVGPGQHGQRCAR